MKHVLAGILLLTTTVAQAQEVPEPRQMFIQGGVMCDTQTDLEVLLTGISLNNGEYPEEVPESCGRFVPEQAVPMTVTPLVWYETPMVSTLVASFVFEANGWTQYGWVAYTPNPDWKPRVEDPDA